MTSKISLHFANFRFSRIFAEFLYGNSTEIVCKTSENLKILQNGGYFELIFQVIHNPQKISRCLNLCVTENLHEPYGNRIHLRSPADQYKIKPVSAVLVGVNVFLLEISAASGIWMLGGLRCVGLPGKRSGIVCVSDPPFILLRWASYLVYFGTKLLSETFIWTEKNPPGFLTFSRYFRSGPGEGVRPKSGNQRKSTEYNKYLLGSSQIHQRTTAADPWWISGTLMTY